MLAHERGGGGQPVLEALSLPPDAINSFVLEMDPVPRALLSVDPTFQLFSVSHHPSSGTCVSICYCCLLNSTVPLIPGSSLARITELHMIRSWHGADMATAYRVLCCRCWQV